MVERGIAGRRHSALNPHECRQAFGLPPFPSMKKMMSMICAFTLGACSSDNQLDRSIVSAQRSELPLLKMVLLRHLRDYSYHRKIPNWTYVLNLSPEVTAEFQQDPAFGGIKLVSCVKAAPRFVKMTSRIAMAVIPGTSNSSCIIALDEADAPLAAATWLFTCAKRGGMWVIVKRELMCVA